MTRLFSIALIALAATAANAQQPPAPQSDNAQILSTLPPNSSSVTNWYKQNVYDPSGKKIGQIVDAVVDNKDGKIVAFVVGVGGFVGVGAKDVAIAFDQVSVTVKSNDKWWLVLNTTKDALKSAPGVKYDRTTTTWVPAAPATTGRR
jgi:sporulation protein YlmC with PRC-barrel domain